MTPQDLQCPNIAKRQGFAPRPVGSHINACIMVRPWKYIGEIINLNNTMGSTQSPAFKSGNDHIRPIPPRLWQKCSPNRPNVSTKVIKKRITKWHVLDIIAKRNNKKVVYTQPPDSCCIINRVTYEGTAKTRIVPHRLIIPRVDNSMATLIQYAKTFRG